MYIVTKAEREKAAKQGKTVRDIIVEREQKAHASKQKTAKQETILASPFVAQIIEDTTKSSYKGRVPEKIIKAQSKDVKTLARRQRTEKDTQDTVYMKSKKPPVLYGAVASKVILSASEEKQREIFKTSSNAKTILDSNTQRNVIIGLGRPVGLSSRTTKVVTPTSITSTSEQQARSFYGDDYKNIPKDELSYYESLASETKARERGIIRANKQGKIDNRQARKEYAILNKDLKQALQPIPSEFSGQQGLFKAIKSQKKEYVFPFISTGISQERGVTVPTQTSQEETIRPQTTQFYPLIQGLKTIDTTQGYNVPKQTPDFGNFSEGKITIRKLSKDTDIIIQKAIYNLESRTDFTREHTQKPVEEFTLLTSKKVTIMPSTFTTAEEKMRTHQLNIKDTLKFGVETGSMSVIGAFKGLKTTVVDFPVFPLKSAKGVFSAVTQPLVVAGVLSSEIQRNPVFTLSVMGGGLKGYKVTTEAATRFISNSFIVPLRNYRKGYNKSKDNIIQLPDTKQSTVVKQYSTRPKISVDVVRDVKTGMFTQPSPGKIEMKAVHTDPISKGTLIQDFGNTKQWTVHVTDAPGFKFDSKGQILLTGSPSGAKGFRQQNDLLHFYRSLPTDKGVTQAYTGYLRGVSPIDYKSQQAATFSLLKPKATLIIEQSNINYIKPLKGETFKAYSLRTGKIPGSTQIPSENIFNLVNERQAITTAQYATKSGTEFPGSVLQKTKDYGWTYFEQGRPLIPRGTGLFSKMGKIKDYYDTEFIKVRLVGTKTLNAPSLLATSQKAIKTGWTKPGRTLDLSTYSPSKTHYSLSDFSSPSLGLGLVASKISTKSKSLPSTSKSLLSPSRSNSLSSSSLSLSSSISSSSSSLSPSRSNSLSSSSSSPSLSSSFLSSSSRSMSPSLSRSILSSSSSPSKSSPSSSPSISSPSMSSSTSSSSTNMPPESILPPPSFGFDLDPMRKKKKKGKGLLSRKHTRYTPSLTAIGFNIRGKKPSGRYFGLRMRPIL